MAPKIFPAKIFPAKIFPTKIFPAKIISCQNFFLPKIFSAKKHFPLKIFPAKNIYTKILPTNIFSKYSGRQRKGQSPLCKKTKKNYTNTLAYFRNRQCHLVSRGGYLIPLAPPILCLTKGRPHCTQHYKKALSITIKTTTLSIKRWQDSDTEHNISKYEPPLMLCVPFVQLVFWVSLTRVSLCWMLLCWQLRGLMLTVG